MIHRRATALMFFVFVEWRRIEVQGSYRYLWEKIYLSVRYQSMSSVENWNSLAYHTCYIPIIGRPGLSTPPDNPGDSRF